MVKKLFLVLLVAGGATASIPDLRERARPHLAPAFEDVWTWWGRQLRPVLDPVFRWSTKNELRSIVRELKERDETFRPLPDPDRFQAYLQRQHVGRREGVDRWGTPYVLRVTPDSIAVVSLGPDREQWTADDVRVAMARR